MLKLKKEMMMFLWVVISAVATQATASEFTIPADTAVNLNAGTINMPGTITVAGSGTLQASTGAITVSDNGNWLNSGNFTYGSSTVAFAGTSHTVSGDNGFYNLNCQITGGIITFEADKTQTVYNSLTLKGAAGSSNYLSLRSSSSGAQWKIYPPATRDIDYVDLKDCNNTTNGTITISNWTDSGNNSYWSTAPSSGGGGGGGGGTGGGTTYISVTSTSPANGASSVGTSTTVTATFSDTMNGSTLTTDTFKLSSGGSNVGGSVGTNGNKATFTPSSNLAYNTTYTVTITTGAQAANAAGSTLNSDYSWSFTTASAPAAATPALTPTPAPSSTPTPLPTVTVAPTSSPNPSPTPASTPSGSLSLSREVAYLSGDTIAVTVVDADRNTHATSEETLSTALKISGVNYYTGGDLLLDMKEDDVNSGTFLATIRTGTTTTGSAGLSTRSNMGTIQAMQGGTATVMYTDTTPHASTITKAVSFSSFDVTLEFDAASYIVGSYAVITHADAEENADNTKPETLLNHAFIDTSSFNRAAVRLVETGADTGTFKGSIQITNTSTLDYERIQVSEGGTLTVSCVDAANTSGFPRTVTAQCGVIAAATPEPSPTLSPTPTPGCTADNMSVSPKSVKIKRGKSKDVSVTLAGTDGCPAEGEAVMVVITVGKGRISVSPASQVTDENGEATFTLTAGKKTEPAKITFKAGGLKKSLSVRVKK